MMKTQTSWFIVMHSFSKVTISRVSGRTFSKVTISGVFVDLKKKLFEQVPVLLFVGIC